MTIRLVYIGKGAALYNVPARDLSEIDMLGRELDEAELLKSGLYEKPKLEQPKKEKAAKDGK